MTGSDTVVLAAGEGARHRMGATAGATVKLAGSDTGGAVTVVEIDLPSRDAGPPLHVHRHTYDIFYILEGTLTLRTGDERRALAAGALACVPPGVLHTIANDSDAPVRLLNVSTPPGQERLMAALDVAQRDGAVTPGQIAVVAAAFDVEVV